MKTQAPQSWSSNITLGFGWNKKWFKYNLYRSIQIAKNIIGLENRRRKLESNDYKSSKGKLMNNHTLYKLFFEKIDELNLLFIK